MLLKYHLFVKVLITRPTNVNSSILPKELFFVKFTRLQSIYLQPDCENF